MVHAGTYSMLTASTLRHIALTWQGHLDLPITMQSAVHWKPQLAAHVPALTMIHYNLSVFQV